MDTRNSLVSVIIPTYNYGKFIFEALDSVLKQTYNDLEIIVVDDDSTDNTREIVTRYVKELPGTLTYIFQKNKGPGAARNTGIARARGGYVAFLDADDIWLPGKLQLQIEVFRSCSDVGFVHTDNSLFSSTGPINNYRFGITAESQMSGNIFPYLLRECIVRTSTVLIKKSCVAKVGLFEETYSGEDYDYWLRTAKICKAGYIGEALVRCREHPEHLVRRDINKTYTNVRRVIRNTIQRFPEIQNDPECRIGLRFREAKCYFEIGYHYFCQGELQEARKNFWVSLQHKFSMSVVKYLLLACVNPGIIRGSKRIKSLLREKCQSSDI
ncbi:MAG: glycosyltransferase [Candidatus Omnitrophota bacterium]